MSKTEKNLSKSSRKAPQKPAVKPKAGRLTKTLTNLEAQYVKESPQSRGKGIRDFKRALDAAQREQRASVPESERSAISRQFWGILRQIKAVSDFCSNIDESKDEEFYEFGQATGALLAGIAKRADHFTLCWTEVKDRTSLHAEPGTITTLVKGVEEISKQIQSLSTIICCMKESGVDELYQLGLCLTTLLDHIENKADSLAGQLDKAFGVICSKG
ncbi:MAG: hypothetical protein ABSC60_09125 [Acidobacteriota bacterium]